MKFILTADKGCPGNPQECIAHCARGGKPGKCEKRWYRWKYRSRCKCNPCDGKLILGACIRGVNVGVSCDGNGQNCSPTGSVDPG
jgi:hypothetical protein